MKILFLLGILLFQEDPIAEVRKAIEKTAGETYFYTVSGKYQRTGVFRPKDLLTARIRQYRMARKGSGMLLKGPSGLWSATGDEGGERAENPDTEDREILQALREAEPPHCLLADILPLLETGRRDADRDVDGIACRVFFFPFRKDRLQEAIDIQLKKAVGRGTMQNPTRIRWATLQGSVRFYVDRQSGALVRALDVRSVKIAYRTQGAEDVRSYRNEMEFHFSGFGEAQLNLPEEVRKRLGIDP